MNQNNYIALFKAAFSKLTAWEDYASPYYFWLLLIIPAYLTYYVLKNRKDQPKLQYSTFAGADEMKSFNYLRHIPIALTLIGLTFIIFSLARLQDAKSWEQTKTMGIDMVLALDISPSMEINDFKPNRLEASKKIASEFITERTNDRFGLVVFAGESFTQCPLTIDHKRIVQLFKDVNTKMLKDGTAIGLGLATAVKRLKDSDAKSNVIILLTDGENNAGEITPKTAAELAQSFDIKVYTIGVGKEYYMQTYRTWSGTFQQKQKTNIDENALNEIAEITGGKYFRATSQNALKNIYEEIDALEKTELASLKFYKKTELFLPFLIVGLICIGISKILEITILKSMN